MKKLEGKVAVIANGNTGIGAGCVRVFINEGCKVVFTSSDEVDGKSFQDEVNVPLEENGGCAKYHECDFSDQSSIEKLIQYTVEKYGRLDCIINTAVCSTNSESQDNLSIEKYNEIIDCHSKAYFSLIKLAIPELRKTHGCIINVSSIIGNIGQSDLMTYYVVESTIKGITRAIAIDEAKNHVRCYSMSPGNVWIPVVDHTPNNTNENIDEIINAIGDMQKNRFKTVMIECGQMALFLAENDTYKSGNDVIITGGVEFDYDTLN